MEIAVLKREKGRRTRAEELLRHIEQELEISVTVHDMYGLLRDKDKRLLLPERYIHLHQCCLRKRMDDRTWNSRCYRDCYELSEKAVRETGKVFIKKCWKGLYEVVVPLICDGTHRLTLYGGVFRGADPAACFDSAPDWFRKAYARLRPFASCDPEAVADLLECFGMSLLFQAGIGKQNLHEGGKAGDIFYFIASNAHRQIELGDLAAHMGISASRCSHLVKEICGASFQDILIRERMERAAIILSSSEQTLESVAENLGYSNGFYFNRAFRKYYGETPGAFRKRISER